MVWRPAWLFLISLLVLVSGCVSISQGSSLAAEATGDCADQFRWWQDHSLSAGIVDAQDWSPPGFPYLRVNRFLASYRFVGLSPEQQEQWLALALDRAVEAWELESQGQGEGVEGRVAGLVACGRQAADRLLAEPGLWPELDVAKVVPDSYNTVARVLGLYPLVVPLVRWRAAEVMGAVAPQLGRNVADERWRFYRPDVEPVPVFAAAYQGGGWSSRALGGPVIGSEELRALIRRHAPRYGIAALSGHDWPGRPGRDLDGKLHFLPEPVVYVQVAFTRWQGQVLPQLVYTIWFSARPATTAVDIYAGALDGLVWRVTLGADGQPLVYDSMHPCGCYHQWLPVRGRLAVRDDVAINREPFWLPAFVPLSTDRPTLYLTSGNHYLVRVAFESARVDAVPYRIEDYRELRGRSYAGGRLFGMDGMIDGSERSERYLLWPTGVVSAGGMRQWGHHAIAFIGRAHFDDPDLLARYFVPAASGATRQIKGLKRQP